MADHAPDQSEHFPVLIPVRKPLSLIPVALKEAALDSPPFRATVVHLSDQFEAVEKWLDGYVRAAAKLAQEVTLLEGLVGTFLTSSTPPAGLSEAVMDHDYTLLALQRYGEGAREYWSHTIGGIKKTQGSVINPIKAFLQNDIKAFKDIRKQLDLNQRAYDSLLARYYSQVKTKEPSALREDAFQLHEAKKAYLRSSMDFCIHGPQLHAALDALLIRVFSDQWLEMKGLRETSTTAFQKHGQEINRVRGWSKDMLHGDRILKRELIMARVQIEDKAEAASRPSRELDDYAASTLPYLGNRPPAIQNETTPDTPSSKQGWLYLRTVTGKPARTNWIRRWFFVKNGIFGWMALGSKSGGVEESEKIGVLLCSVRPAFQEERRFCFEVKTKDSALMLQAETQTDLSEWMSVFDTAKQKAIEDPSSTELLASSGNPSSDPAFAVSPAIAPELAVKEDLAGIIHTSEHSDAGLPRANTDIGVRRKVSRSSNGESGRDHAARFIHQKLDLHKKTTAGTVISGGSAGSTPLTSNYGIASLINASHSAMPVSPGRSDTFPRKPVVSQTSLAPTTLVQPPAPTNLSKIAVAIGAERGLDLGAVDTTGGVPSSIMANQWGTTNYGHLSRIERGEVKGESQRHVSTPVGGLQRRSSDPAFAVDGSEQRVPLDNALADLQPIASSSAHRKTFSEQDPSVFQRRVVGSSTDYPTFYPASLKAHDTQMRMLFPNVPHDDRAVLVFRASWNPDERQDLPGRVFVTLNDLYFYSHHYGFTLVSGVALSRVLDVSITRQGPHDVLYLHIEGEGERDDSTTITIKTFLEPARVLQRRLKFLTSNRSAEEPATLEEALRILINLESSHSSAESDDDDDVSPARSTGKRRYTGGGPPLRVDRSLFGGDGTITTDANDVLKFRLPTQAVNYSPKGMDEIAVEGLFNVSAKALFHIMFGDLSVLSQMLYRERRAINARQYPWTSLDNDRWTRKFEYEISNSNADSSTTMSDTQTVDIANDHLCYVVTDLKAPWHLPHADDFSLVTKVVITHVAKSKCLLRIFTSVEWRQYPSMSMLRDLIERHAIEDLRLDAQDLYGLVSDQVQRLGPDCYTKKAIQIFGHLGQQTEIAQITAANPSVLAKSSRLVVRRKTASTLMLEGLRSIISSAITTITMTILGGLLSLFKLINGHTILSLLLAASLAVNTFSTTRTASTYWHERSAINLVSTLGVGPNVALSKSIHLSDIDSLISLPPSDFYQPTTPASHKCANTFRTVLAASDPDAPVPTAAASNPTFRSSTRRLLRSRQRMGTYRHDLLVALRLINSVERELVQTEYENWVLDESKKCAQIGPLLAAAAAGEERRKVNGTTAVGELNLNLPGKEALRVSGGWYEEYCGSCYGEKAALLRGRRGEGL